MRKTAWYEWEQEAYDYADNRYGHLPSSERWEREAWRAWLAGRDSVEFVDEYMRDRHPEP